MTRRRATVSKPKTNEYPSITGLIVWGFVLWGIGLLAGVINH